ncbi:hypothetical protein BH11MYX1_BH11MYX1_21470 [soil metagenome]
MKQGNVVMKRGAKFDGVKVFSATMSQQRAALGEDVTAWLASHPTCKPIEVIVTQSSDAAYHCITITVFYAEEREAKMPARGTRKIPVEPTSGERAPSSSANAARHARDDEPTSRGYSR